MIILQWRCCQNKVKGLNCKLTSFQVNQANFSKGNFLSQYWQNGNTEVKGKLFALNRNILKRKSRRKFKFGEDAFEAFSNVLVKSEKLDLNAILRQSY